jgi:hypothetical protein
MGSQANVACDRIFWSSFWVLQYLFNALYGEKLGSASTYGDGACIGILSEIRPPLWEVAVPPTPISGPLVDKNIVEFNDLSYSTVIGCYQLLYIP